MEQSLIEKYLAGETSAQENQLLRQQLQAKSADICTNEEKALLIMLTGSHQEEDNSEDIFAVDYSCEYDKIVHRNKVRKMTKLVSAITAIAACIAIVWFVGLHSRNDSEESPTQTTSQHPQYGENNYQRVLPSNGIHSPQLPEGEGDASAVNIPVTKENPSDSNHYAWAKSLMESYHEEDLDDLEDNPNNTFRQDKEWAQNIER